MTNYARVQGLIDKGLGKAGNHVGQPYQGYRVDRESNGDFPTGWTRLSNCCPTNVLRRRIRDSSLESGMKSGGTIWFDLIGNMAPYLLGDILICIDPPYCPGKSYGDGATGVANGNGGSILLDDGSGSIQLDNGKGLIAQTNGVQQLEFNGFGFAWHFPPMVPKGARVERRCQIYRPANTPATLADGSNYYKETLDNDQPLILSDGIFAFGTQPQTASFVPIGLTSTERPAGKVLFPPNVPGMTPIIRYYGYLPPLPGYTPIEGDALVMEDGSRYLVINPYFQTVGVVGAQLSLEREISQV